MPSRRLLRAARLSCRRFAADPVRLQLHALAYNLASFLRTLALAAEVVGPVRAGMSANPATIEYDFTSFGHVAIDVGDVTVAIVGGSGWCLFP